MTANEINDKIYKLEKQIFVLNKNLQIGKYKNKYALINKLISLHNSLNKLNRIKSWNEFISN